LEIGEAPAKQNHSQGGGGPDRDARGLRDLLGLRFLVLRGDEVVVFREATN
jgi:hypothetical protein